MGENNRECAEYFKGQKAYRRCFQELLKKWKSYGKAAGRISLKNTSEEEKKAIGGLLGKNFYVENICFSFADFEKSLQKTRYAPVEMKGDCQKGKTGILGEMPQLFPGSYRNEIFCRI